MARETAQSTEEIVLENIGEGFEDEAMRREQRIATEFSQSGGDVNYLIRVWSIAGGANQKGVKEEWLFDCDQSEYHDIRQKLIPYGTGLYRVRVYRNGQIFSSVDWPIRVLEQKAETQREAPANNDALILIANTLRQQGEQIASLTTELISFRRAPVPQTQDPFSMFERMAGMMASMVGLRPQIQPENSVEKYIDALTKGMELGRSIEGNEEGGMTGMVKSVIPLVQDFIKAAANAPTQAPQAQRIQRPAQVAPQPQAAPQSETPPAQTSTMDFGTLMGILVTRAQKGSDAALYADVLYDLLDDTTLQTLLNTPDIFNIIAQQFPAIAPYPEWFNTLLDTLREIWHMQGEAPAPERDATGNTGPAHTAT